MNKRQKEVLQAQLDNEKAVLKRLEENYEDALAEINSKIELLMARQDADMQHVIYQVEYQKALKTQVQAILEQLQANEFETVSEYLAKSYEEGFLGTMYDLQGQGIPLVFPMDQAQVVAAIQHETQLSETLYTSLGKDVKDLSKKIAGEISRGISGGQMYSEIARNVSNWARIPKNNAMRIARTEAHRIQCKATADAQFKAKEKGADVVKQWDSSLDRRTRKTHRELDGQIRELEEPFEVNGKQAMQPGGFGRPEEDINCRCALLQRARWALGNDYTKWSPDAPVVIDDDGTTQFTIIEAKNFKDFQKKYNQATERVREGAQMMNDIGTSHKKAVNKNGEEIVFNLDKTKPEHRQRCVEIINELSAEYETYLTSVNVGAKGVAGGVGVGGYMELSSFSPVTIYHEFAHALTSQDRVRLKLASESEKVFERKLARLYGKYVEDSRKNPSLSISAYSHDSKDEFMAEAFAQYKLKDKGVLNTNEYGTDYTYSKQVIDLIDEYFKK